MNPQRGDVAITLDGNEYTLRLTFEAISGIEHRLDTGVVGVLRRFMRSEAGYRDAEAVIAEGIKGGGQKPPKDLRKIITSEGIVKIAGPLTIYLTNAVTGDKPQEEKEETEGEAKAET